MIAVILQRCSPSRLVAPRTRHSLGFFINLSSCLRLQTLIISHLLQVILSKINKLFTSFKLVNFSRLNRIIAKTVVLLMCLNLTLRAPQRLVLNLINQDLSCVLSHVVAVDARETYRMVGFCWASGILRKTGFLVMRLLDYVD